MISKEKAQAIILEDIRRREEYFANILVNGGIEIRVFSTMNIDVQSIKRMAIRHAVPLMIALMAKYN